MPVSAAMALAHSHGHIGKAACASNMLDVADYAAATRCLIPKQLKLWRHPILDFSLLLLQLLQITAPHDSPMRGKFQGVICKTPTHHDSMSTCQGFDETATEAHRCTGTGQGAQHAPLLEWTQQGCSEP